MIEKPLFNNLSPKVYDFVLLLLIALMFAAICAEADMYVPAFPEMIKQFGIPEHKIQLVLSLNFFGLCIAGLVAGPLSDTLGRRKVLLGGLLLFVVSSIGCVSTDSFYVLLFWRVLQGFAASTPMVVSAAMVFDRFAPEKAGQLMGILNSFITLCMAAAPIIGAALSQAFNWKANFWLILGFAIVIFLGTLFFVQESHPAVKRKPFNVRILAGDYLTISKSFVFMANTILVCFPLVVIVLYISNLSVIFINHIGMSPKVFGYYQATTMGTFVVFSLLSIKLIGKKGIDYTKNLGGSLALIGAVSLFVTSRIDAEAVSMICTSMAFVAAGGALMCGTFGVRAMEVFPHMNGTALALLTAVRQSLASGLVILSEVFFDGTIKPIASLMITYAIVGVLCYAGLYIKQRNNKIVLESFR